MSMDWSAYEQGQEDAAFGQFLVECIAHWCGLDGDEEHLVGRIAEAIYKGTDCGAWVVFDELGIKVGTIVEGSDAEYSERVDVSKLDCGDDDEKQLHERFSDAIQRCEDFADEHFNSEEDE
jgi:tRNA-binding EMAP/Myf-like protein